MIKRISQYAQDRFAVYMAENHPDFKKVRVSLAKTACPSGDVYAKAVDKDRIGWIVFGASKGKDKNLYAAIGWTRSGLKLLDLPYWEKRTHPDIPGDGLSNLVDEALIGDDFGSNGRFIEVAEPSLELRKRALESYKQTDLYKKIAESSRANLLKKNPNVSEAEIQADLEMVHRGKMGFMTIWAEVEKFIELDVSTLDEITRPALDKTCYLLAKYGIPFLDARLR